MPTRLEVFQAFVQIGATAFGGGGSAHIYNALVLKRGWLSESEFLECFTLCQTLPGPIFSNLAAHIGTRLAGFRGGVVACLGLNLPGALMILLIAVAYTGLRGQARWLEGALLGVAAAAVGISLTMLARIVPSAVKPVGAIWLALAAFVGNGVLHINILWVLAGLVPIGMLLNWKAAQIEADDTP
jgi:chromate transporter